MCNSVPIPSSLRQKSKCSECLANCLQRWLTVLSKRSQQDWRVLMKPKQWLEVFFLRTGQSWLAGCNKCNPIIFILANECNRSIQSSPIWWKDPQDKKVLRPEGLDGFDRVFCGKTPPRNHTISIKEMLLCWLDVKRPCVLYQNGEESSEQTRVSRPRWADKGSACSLVKGECTQGLKFSPSWQHTLAPFCCLMFLAPQFPFSRKPCR